MSGQYDYSRFRDYGYERDHLEGSIWSVDDTLLEKPEQRFFKTHQPLIEATVESWDGGLLRHAPVPKDAIKFVKQFVDMFGVVPSKHTNVEDVFGSVLAHIDYYDPYFVLVDMPIQLTNHAALYTYKVKNSGETLNPRDVEVFEYNPKWDYAPYKSMQAVMTHPATKAFLDKSYIPEQYLLEAHRNREDRESAWIEALHRELLPKLVQMFFGSMAYYEGTVTEYMYNFYEGAMDSAGDEITAQEIRDSETDDRLFWMLAFLGGCTWLKSPRALGFLTSFHMVYGCILEMDGDKLIYGEWGTKVIVDGCNLYTLREVAEIESAPPGTCELCAAPLHCTKLVNIPTINNSVCSCGGSIDPRDISMIQHTSKLCRDYQQTIKDRIGFVCQRCLFVKANNLDPYNTKCGRTICPAGHCKHHMGAGHLYAALTERRTKQLTSNRPR